MVPEVEKAAKDKGRYMTPKELGKDPSLQIGKSASVKKERTSRPAGFKPSGKNRSVATIK